MRTYTTFQMLLACCAIIGCSKSEDQEIADQDNFTTTNTNYTVLLKKDGELMSTLLNAGSESIVPSPSASSFPNMAAPELTYKDNSLLLLYQEETACNGKVIAYDFKEDLLQEMDVFADVPDCNLSVNAIAGSQDRLFVAYEIEVTSKGTTYFVRTIDLTAGEPDFSDIELDKKPLEMVFSNNRLFVLTLDEEITDENSLAVLNTGTNLWVHEMDLGFNVRKIFKTPDGNIIIGYDELHTTLDSNDFSFAYTQYGEGTQPSFNGSNFNYFDEEGRMYYTMVSGSFSQYPSIPAVYDFGVDLTVLYVYENFLTETQRDFEFEIESTTMVSYDQENGLILVGYKKMSDDGKGGLLRIKPVPDPKFVDNTNLEGIPFYLNVD